MDTNTAIFERRTVHAFNSKKVDEKLIYNAINAAMRNKNPIICEESILFCSINYFLLLFLHALTKETKTG